jgi:hypothetical protein
VREVTGAEKGRDLGEERGSAAWERTGCSGRPGNGLHREVGDDGLVEWAFSLLGSFIYSASSPYILGKMLKILF